MGKSCAAPHFIPAKLIIWCPGRPALNGHKRRSFQWNPDFNCFVHENKIMDEKEFNAVVESVFKRNSDLRPCVRVVEFSDGVALAPVATISTAREVGIDEALEIVQRLAPEKLRKTSQGRPPSAKPTPMMEVG